MNTFWFILMIVKNFYEIKLIVSKLIERFKYLMSIKKMIKKFNMRMSERNFVCWCVDLTHFRLWACRFIDNMWVDKLETWIIILSSIYQCRGILWYTHNYDRWSFHNYSLHFLCYWSRHFRLVIFKIKLDLVDTTLIVNSFFWESFFNCNCWNLSIHLFR